MYLRGWEECYRVWVGGLVLAEPLILVVPGLHVLAEDSGDQHHQHRHPASHHTVYCRLVYVLLLLLLYQHFYILSEF